MSEKRNPGFYWVSWSGKEMVAKLFNTAHGREWWQLHGCDGFITGEQLDGILSDRLTPPKEKKE